MTVHRFATAYRDRVAAVVNAILQDPTRDHHLKDLAAIAHFSPFHFHRIYQGVTGETVAATVRRIRLTRATQLLSRVSQSVTQIALDVGYESPQAFTRAFRQFTGESPRDFRKKMRAAGEPFPNERHAAQKHALPLVRVVERPALRVHALRHRGPEATIPHTHRRLRVHVGERQNLQWLGISFGDPAAAVDFAYYAAVDLPAVASDREEIEAIEMPAGRYAVHRLDGPYSQINAAIGALYSLWLPQSGYEPDDRPTVEHYLNSPLTVKDTALHTDLLIPVRALR